MNIMRRMLLFVIFVSAGLNLFSQSIADLDRDPSFKGIKIGDPISKYTNILKYKGVRKGKNVYTITDQQYYSIFNVKMQEVVVVESNGKVWAILLSKSCGQDLFNPKELETLKSSLEFRYNSPNLDLTDSSVPVAGYRWQAKNIILDIVYLFPYEGSKLQYFLYQREDDY